MKSFKKFHRTLSKRTLSVACSVVAVAAIFFCSSLVRADIGSNFYGYFGSNAGLVKLNDCDNLADSSTCNPASSYGASALAAAPGTLTGYAWSSNLGWISFNSSVGCPTTGCNPGAHVDWTTNGSGAIKGWARVCSVYVSGCSGALKSAAYLGSAASSSGSLCDTAGTDANCQWDGYIALDSATAGGIGGWGLSVTNGAIGGYAWGSQVIGWVNDINGNVYLGGPTVLLTASPAQINVGSSSTLTVTATNIDGPTACAFANMQSSLTMQQQSDGTWTGSIVVTPPIGNNAYTVHCTKGSQIATGSTNVNVIGINQGTDGTDSGGSTTGSPDGGPGGGPGGGGGSATGGGSGGTSGSFGADYCTLDYPEFTWNAGDATSCTMSENGKSIAVPTSSAEAGRGGILGSDGLYYLKIDLPISGASSTYTLQCTGGSAPVSLQQTVKQCQPDYQIIPSDVSPVFTPVGDGTTSTATYTVRINPVNGMTDPISLSVSSWPPVLLAINSRTATFVPATMTYDGSSYGTATFTITINTADLKQSISPAVPVVIQGVSANSNITRTATVYVGATVKIKPKFNEF